MNDVFAAVQWVHLSLEELGLRHAFIGGIALQAWGEPRLTRDVDVSVWTGLIPEEETIRSILSRIPPRVSDALAHALNYRVLLGKSTSDIGVDLALAGFEYEEAALSRSVTVSLTSEIRIPVISAEDLIIMKAFAGRERDWIDIKGIVARQHDELDWNLITRELEPLLELVEAPERLVQLRELREEISKMLDEPLP